ncbi:MAG: CPBP family intramembrane metalloprotease [Bacteroidetes bacterium]|nr:MAG: CPBP family intramembrane metalloprotease [Bacteroidota bacterium]
MQENIEPQKEFQSLALEPKFPNVKFANKYLVIILCIYLFSGILIELVNPLQQGKFLAYLQGSAQLLLMFLPALIFSRFSPLTFKTLFRLESKPSLLIIILSLTGIIVLSLFETSYLFLQDKLIPEFLQEIYKTTEKAIEDLYNQILGGNGFFDMMKALAIGAIIPALSEETLFRGMYQRSLEEDLKPSFAILISGLVFALVHLNPINIIPLLTIGLYLGVVAYGTKSLIIPIILHFLNNAVAVLVMYTPSLSQLDSQSYNLNIPSAILMCVISFSFLIIISIVIYRNGK